MIGQYLKYLRLNYVRPVPARFLVAAAGLLVVFIPALRPFTNVRFIALVGVVLALATIALSFTGLPTTICGLGIVETTIVTVHEGGFVLAVVEAIALLAYLVIVDLSPVGGEWRPVMSDLRADLASAFAGGLALLAVVAAVSLVNLTGSFAVAIVGVVAAGVVVAALRWMLSDG